MNYARLNMLLRLIFLAASFFIFVIPGTAVSWYSGKDLYISGVPVATGGWRDSLSAQGSLLDTNYSILTPGTWPAGVTREANFFWNTDIDSARIYKLTFSGNVSQEFQAPAYVPAGIDWDGAHLWLVDEQEARLYKIDPAQGDTIASYSLPDSASADPNSFGLAWDGNYLWHTQYGDSARVFKIDPATGAVLSSFDSPANYMLGIAWEGTYLAGIDVTSQTLYRINPVDGEVVDNYPWPVPYPLGLYFDGEDYWNVSGSIEHGGNQAIYRVSLETGIKEIIGPPTSITFIESYPNPFNSSTQIYYFLPHGSTVLLDIYNISGQRVENLVNRYQDGGKYLINWRPSGLTSGIYFGRLVAGDNESNVKLLFLK